MAIDTVYFGNTIMQYIISFAILAIGILVGIALHWIFKNIFVVFAGKTKNTIDDLIVEAIKGPVVFFIFYISFNYSYRLLTLSERAATVCGNISFILLVIFFAWLARNIVNSFILNFFEKIASKTESDLDDHLLPVIRGLLNIIIFAIALIYMLDNMGYDIGSLIAGLGIGGLAFALAAQDTVKNLFGGFTVFADKPFKIGDRIRVDGGPDGFVEEIGVRSTKIKTFDGTIYVLPNSKVVDNILENVSAERARRIKITLGLEYDTTAAKLEKAKKILAEIVKKNKNTEDRSLVTFKEFADSSLNIQVIYWIENLDNILTAIDEVNMEIKKRFDKEKLSFAFPSTTVYLKK